MITPPFSLQTPYRLRIIPPSLRSSGMYLPHSPSGEYRLRIGLSKDAENVESGDCDT